MEDPGKMKVAELRASLERRGLNTSGLKQVLQETSREKRNNGLVFGSGYPT